MTANTQIASILNNIGNMLEILGENPFKIRAYINASKTIMLLEEDINDINERNQLTGLKGIGKDLSLKINEYLNTGKIEYYEELSSRVPEDLLKIKSIQGIGPKLLQTLFNDFNVRNITDLENTLSDPDFINKKGVGSKKINELKVGVKLFKSFINKINIGFALPAAENLIKELLNCPSINNADITGGLARGTETVETAQIIAVSADLKNSIKEISKLPSINKDSININDRIINLKLNSGISVKIFLSEAKNFNTVKFFETGCNDHVDRISKIYEDKGFELKEQHFSDQHEIYKKIGLQYVPPELREGSNEIDLAAENSLPALIRQSDIKGDLHTHSTWSDGKSTIPEMAMAARALGYEYIAITDHSVSSRIANGLDTDRLMKKKEELLETDASLEGINIIFGSEVDIKPDGSLDYPDEILKGIDMIVASVHSSFKMDEEEMTARITKALSNPFVCALGHPTGRLIGERNPYKLDINAVIDTAKKYGKALEVNSSYMRLDLKDEHIKMAIDKGVKLIISTDAHHTGQLNQMRYGISNAGRGHAEKKNVINTLPYAKLREWLDRFK